MAFDSKYTTQFMTRLHAGVAAAKSKERGDISQSFRCPMQFPFIVQNIQVYFWMMTRYFPLFVKKRGLTLKKGAKRGQNRENALLKGQPFFKRAVWGPCFYLPQEYYFFKVPKIYKL